MTRRLVWLAAPTALLTALGLTAVAGATPPSGVTGTVVASGSLQQGLDVKVKTRSGHRTKVSRIKGEGQALVQQLTVQPGGNTGWHSHPGPAFVVVQKGALTVLDAGDRRCAGRTYTAGEAFVDPGHGHIHIARNLGTEPAEVWVTYLLPEDATSPRIDAADPGTCSF